MLHMLYTQERETEQKRRTISDSYWIRRLMHEHYWNKQEHLSLALECGAENGPMRKMSSAHAEGWPTHFHLVRICNRFSPNDSLFVVLK